MNILEKNQNYLAKMKVALAKDTEKISDDVKYKKEGEHYVAEINNVRCFVNSTYNIEHEIEDMFAKTPENVEHIVLFGCGTGNAVRYALDTQNFPDLISLTIVEPSVAWFSILTNETDLEETWGDNDGKIKVLIGYDPDVAGRLLTSEIAAAGCRFSIVYHVAERTMFFEYYQKMGNAITEQLQNITMLFASNKKLLYEKTYNEVLNLSRSSYDFRDINDIFEGKNIIIVSAGPSLQKNIHLLEAAKKKAVVVAVGSSIDILEKRGIVPHFRMALDPFVVQYEFFVNISKSAPLIYTNALYAEILSSYKGDVVCANAKTDYLSAFLYNKQKRTTEFFRSGPTVANMANEIFCASGIKRMIFIGQDMCMYGQQLYADTDKYLPYAACVDEESKDMMRLKDIHGNDVVAPRNYYLVKQYLEDAIVRFADKVEFINATEGGLGLVGAANKPFAEVLDILDEDDIEPVLNERFKKAELFDFRTELYEIKKQVDDIENLNSENVKDLTRIKDILLKDEHLLNQERYKKAFKKAQKNEQKMKKIEFHKEIVQSSLEIFLEEDCLQWGKGIDDNDPKVKYRSILEIQLRTANTTKDLLDVYKKAFQEVFS
jgi:hypothetical protein